MTDGAALSIIAILLGAVALLGLAIWSIKRHKDPQLSVATDVPIDRLVASLSGIALGHPIAGNSAQLVQNGAFFERLLEDIAAARRSVHFETFLWKDGLLGRRMAQAFSKAARSGVAVRLVLDANGCKKMGRAVRRQMEQAGCQVALFHPRILKNIGVVLERDHRKLAILDGRVAWVGGHCVVDEWLGDARNKNEVRDISVRLRGPVVQAVQSVFSENWVEVTGKLFVGDDVFPPPEEAGEVVAHVASLKPEGSAPAVKILHHTVLCCARKRIWIQNPYFIPEPDAVKAFAAAVKRGVDVRIMVPSAGASDMRMVQHAAHRNFQQLLDSGVRIFEYHRTLLHQKVMTIDGVWCAVGSSNFDDRSFETNDEVMVGLLSARLARELEELFEADRRHCVELDAQRWRRRGVLHKLQDSAFYLFNEVL
jgi:cardiolipin synthase